MTCPNCNSNNIKWLRGLISVGAHECFNCGITFDKNDPYTESDRPHFEETYPGTKFYYLPTKPVRINLDPFDKIFQEHPLPWTITPNHSICPNGSDIIALLDANKQVITNTYVADYSLLEFLEDISDSLSGD